MAILDLSGMGFNLDGVIDSYVDTRLKEATPSESVFEGNQLAYMANMQAQNSEAVYGRSASLAF